MRRGQSTGALADLPQTSVSTRSRRAQEFKALRNASVKDPLTAKRRVLTVRRRAASFDLPRSLPDVLIHHTPREQDRVIVGRRRGDTNRLGFALHPAAFRYPARLIQPGEKIPEVSLEHVSGQIGVCPDAAGHKRVTGTTRCRRSGGLQRLWRDRPCPDQALVNLKAWRPTAARSAQAGAKLLERRRKP